MINSVSTYSCDADRRKLKSQKSNLLNALKREKKTWNKLSTFVLQHNSSFLFSLLLHIRKPFFPSSFLVSLLLLEMLDLYSELNLLLVLQSDPTLLWESDLLLRKKHICVLKDYRDCLSPNVRKERNGNFTALLFFNNNLIARYVISGNVFLCLSCLKQKHLIIIINVFCKSTLKHKGFWWQFFSGKKKKRFSIRIFNRWHLSVLNKKLTFLRLLTLGLLSYRFNQALLLSKRFNLFVFSRQKYFRSINSCEVEGQIWVFSVFIK